MHGMSWIKSLLPCPQNGSDWNCLISPWFAVNSLCCASLSLSVWCTLHDRSSETCGQPVQFPCPLSSALKGVGVCSWPPAELLWLIPPCSRCDVHWHLPLEQLLPLVHSAHSFCHPYLQSTPQGNKCSGRISMDAATQATSYTFRTLFSLLNCCINSPLGSWLVPPPLHHGWLLQHRYASGLLWQQLSLWIFLYSFRYQNTQS